MLAVAEPTIHIIIIGAITSLIGAIVVGVVIWILRAARTQVEGWFKAVMTEVKPNGGKSPSNGDTTKRTEEAVNKLASQFEHHRNAVNRRLRTLEKQGGIAK